MMPLTMANIDDEMTVVKVSGSAELRQHLNDLGFVAGTKVSVVSKTGENVIVAVKGSRIALGRDLAKKIMV